MSWRLHKHIQQFLFTNVVCDLRLSQWTQSGVLQNSPVLTSSSGFAAHWMSLQIFLVNTVTGILCPLWDVITVWRRPYLSLCVWAIRGSAAFVLRLHRNKRVFLLYRRGGNSSRPLDHLEAAALWQEAATESTASLKLIKCHKDLSCNLDFFMINSCWRTFRGPAGFCCVADEDRLAAVSSPTAAQLCRVYCNAWFDLNEAWRRHICVSSNLVWSLIQMLMLR